MNAASTESRGRRFAGSTRRGMLAGLCLVLVGLDRDATATTPAAPGSTGPVVALPAAVIPNVLVLYPDHRLLEPNVRFDAAFRGAIDGAPGRRIECFSEFLDERRFPERHRERMLELLRGKYGGRPPDVVVTFSGPSLEFCLRHRSNLFPSVPIVFVATGSDLPDAIALEPGVTGLRPTFDTAATLRMALRLHPRTRQVYIVESAPEGERSGASRVPSGLRDAAPATTFHRLSSRSLPDLLPTLSQLPEHSLVIDLSMLENGIAGALAPQEIAERIAGAARAPVYGVSDPVVGTGVVAAVATPMDVIGREAAALVGQILAAGPAAALPAARTLAAVPIFDWRQVRRWDIQAKHQPTGAIVRFKPPSLWEQHRTSMLIYGGLFLLQSGLILALVLQSRSRRRAEREAQRHRRELEHMTRVATMGELTASLAHEINQPLAAILMNAQAAQRLMAAGAGDGEEIREIVADIVADDQRAGEVIRRMRALLRKAESAPAVLDVNDLVAEVAVLVRGEMILQNVSLILDLAPHPRLVHGDRIQLQQVLLNLVINALDAMKDRSTGSRRVVVHTAAANGGDVHVAVDDSGAGVPPDKLEQIFEPFVTTKPHGMGLGLAICRSIIQRHGGRIGTTNNVDGGATFWFTLPMAGEVKP